MPKFTYTATNAQDETVKGVAKADDITALKDSLHAGGLKLQSAKEKKSVLQMDITKNVPANLLMQFSRQLAAFVRAGIPILDGIDTIAAEMENRLFKEALTDISLQIAGGKNFSDAAAEHPYAFPPFYVRTLRSAELTGQLDAVLDQLSGYIERDEDAKRKVKSAMVYPVIVLVMAAGTVAVLTIFVLPKFKVLFEEFDAKLPLTTRIVMGSGDFIREWWLPFLVAIVALTAGYVAALRTRKGRRLRDQFLLKIPVLGDVFRYAIIERFCRVLSSLMHSAVSIPDALEVATEGTNNLVYEDALLAARVEIMEGHGLARPISATGLFPSTVLQMVRVGEETGTLDTQLQTAANFFEIELDYKLKRFTTMIEPAVIIMVGVVVGFVAISLVQAMYGVYSQAKI